MGCEIPLKNYHYCTERQTQSEREKATEMRETRINLRDRYKDKYRERLIESSIIWEERCVSTEMGTQW